MKGLDPAFLSKSDSSTQRCYIGATTQVQDESQLHGTRKRRN